MYCCTHFWAVFWQTNPSKKVKAHNEYIEYLRNMITQEEAALEKTENAQVKDAIQRRIDAFKVDLEKALPDAVKAEVPVDEVLEESSEEVAESEDATVEETVTQEESYEANAESTTLTEGLTEDADLEVSADEFEELIKSPDFQKPISDTAVRAMLAMEDEEKKEEKKEQAILRREYIDSVKASFTSQMGPKEEWIQLRKEQEAKKKGK